MGGSRSSVQSKMTYLLKLARVRLGQPMACAKCEHRSAAAAVALECRALESASGAVRSAATLPPLCVRARATSFSTPPPPPPSASLIIDRNPSTLKICQRALVVLLRAAANANRWPLDGRAQAHDQPGSLDVHWQRFKATLLLHFLLLLLLLLLPLQPLLLLLFVVVLLLLLGQLSAPEISPNKVKWPAQPLKARPPSGQASEQASWRTRSEMYSY